MNRKELKGIRSQKLEEMIREWQPWKGEMDHGMSIIINTMYNINGEMRISNDDSEVITNEIYYKLGMRNRILYIRNWHKDTVDQELENARNAKGS